MGLKVKEGARPKGERGVTEHEKGTIGVYTLPPGREPSIWNKSTERVVKDGGVRDIQLAFAEKAMQFGLFCITLIYFRAKWLLKRQRQTMNLSKLGWDVDISGRASAMPKDLHDPVVKRMHVQDGHGRIKVIC